MTASTGISEPPPRIERVSVVGLGPMGSRMAARLLAGGVEIDAWNRSPAPREAFRAAGGTARERPADLIGEIVLAALPDLDELEPLVFGAHGLLDGPARGSRILAVTSTTGPARVRELGARLARDGRLRLVDAPVSGGVSGAEAGTLSIMLGGDPADVSRLRPVLRRLGTAVEHFGPLGSGSLAKLCNQLVVAGTLCALAEAMELGELAGLDGERLVRVLANGLADSAVLRRASPRMLSGDYAGGGSARNQLKDLRYAVAEAERLRAPLAVGRTLLATFDAVVASGRGSDDHAVVRELLRDRGSSRGDQS